MINLLKNINREDVYYIIVPVILVVVPGCFNSVNKHVKDRFSWKNVIKSPLEKWISYEIRLVFVLYVVSLIMSVIISFIIYILIFNVYKIKNFVLFLNIIFYIFSIILHVYILRFIYVSKKKEKLIVLKKNYKYGKFIGSFLFYFPVILNCLIILFAKSKIISLILTVLFVLCLLTALGLLDTELEYNSVSFILKDGTIIDKVLLININQKGIWIIVKNESGDEILFKQTEVIRMIYQKKENSL